MAELTEDQNDWQLLRATSDGHSAAFEVLLRRYERLLNCIVFRRAASLLKYACLQEIIDETWYQVLRRAPASNVARTVKFSSWLVGLCLNVLKQKSLRPLGARLGVTDRHGELFADDPPDEGESPAQAVERAELLGALKDCVAERAETEHTLYQLIYIDGLTEVAAAKQLEFSEAYVRQKLLPRLHHALKLCLATKGFHDVTSSEIV